jgi:four helix bundle protein
MFIAQDKAIELIAALRPIIPIIERNDRDLGDQLRRASSSVALNLAEGSRSAKGNKARHSRSRMAAQTR